MERLMIVTKVLSSMRALNKRERNKEKYDNFFEDIRDLIEYDDALIFEINMRLEDIMDRLDTGYPNLAKDDLKRLLLKVEDEIENFGDFV